MIRPLAKLRRAIYNGQEFVLWLPGMVLLTVCGYVILGALVPMPGDALAWLAELPALCAYAAAALGASWVIKALYMHDIPSDREEALHAAAMAGDAGARWILIKDRIETVLCIILAFVFFWPAR